MTTSTPIQGLAAEFVDWEVAATTVPDERRAVVGAISDVHPTGILTNGDGPVQRRKIEAHGLDDLVDAVVVSIAVGVQKPDSEVFRIAEERLPGDEYLYVGDSHEEDIVEARDVDWRAIYVRSDDGTRVSVADVGALDHVLDLG